MTDTDVVTISRDQYEKLLKDSDFLEILELNGVDNWDYYGDCHDQYQAYLLKLSKKGDNS